MAIAIPIEVNRTKGYLVKTGTTLVAGMVVTKDPTDSTGETIMLSDGTTTNKPMGLALDTNVAYSDSSQYYDDFAKGGYVALSYGPILAELSDDGRGSPYISTVSYTVNEAVYCGSDGRITNVKNGTISIGNVDKVPSSTSATLRVRIALP